jgi:hypothetical protein
VERRQFLAAGVAAGLGGCALADVGADDSLSGEDEAVSRLPFSPWHLWGSSETSTVGITGGGGVFSSSQTTHQLAKISYKRPETWRFFLFGRILGGTTGAVLPTALHAIFDVMVGVGRTNFDTTKRTTGLGVPGQFNGFAEMRWNVVAGVVPGAQNFNRKFCTEVSGPPLDDTALTTLQRIDHIVAQDIQCNCRVLLSNGDLGIQIQYEVGAFFAPNVHVRPDWFDGQYPTELGGT